MNRWWCLVLVSLIVGGCASPSRINDEVAIEDIPPEGVVADTLVKYVQAYGAKDVEAFVEVFALDATHNGNEMPVNIERWEKHFAKMNKRGIPQSWVFEDVRIKGPLVTAWFTETANRPTPCSGPYKMRFTGDGLIDTVESACSDAEYDTEALIDPSIMGQGVDIGSTSMALATGAFVEGNPIANVTGVPLFFIGKMAMTQYAGTLPLRDCKAGKHTLAFTGWGAGAWNLCLLAAPFTGGASIAVCGAAAGTVGYIAYNNTEEDSLMACWNPLDEVDEWYRRIDANGLHASNRVNL